MVRSIVILYAGLRNISTHRDQIFAGSLITDTAVITTRNESIIVNRLGILGKIVIAIEVPRIDHTCATGRINTDGESIIGVSVS